MSQQFEQMMVKLGIPVYTDTYYTLINGGAQAKIGQDMPNSVGYIFGISTIVNGVQPTDQTKIIISTAQASAIWLYLKIGVNLFQNNFRLDKLIFEDSTAPGQYANQRRYFDVSIPRVMDLKESYYLNPTAIGTPAAPRFVALQIYYIDIASYDLLVKKKYMFRGVDSIPEAGVRK